MLVLLSARLGHLANADKRMDSPLSREGSFLLNNLLLVGFAFTVLLGTLYPLIVEATTSERISVGAPYFDTMTAPICMGLIFLMGVGPVLPWGRAEPALMKQLFVRPLALGFVMAAVLFLLGLRNGWVLTTWGLAVFAASASLREIWLPARARMRGQGENALNAVWTASRKGRRRFGGHIVHLGVVVIAVSLASAGAYRQHQDLTLEKGESAEVYGHTLTFIQSELQDQPHRVSQVALFEVRRGGGRTQELAPRINRYKARGDEVPTPAVLSAPDADFYLSLLRVDEEQASVRVIHQPLVLWIWVGGLMMVIGGLIASFPERLLARKRASA
jgi:cytochrome c-type biogenesis protein CcmF